MSNSPGIVEGEWDDQPHNWRTFFKRWRRSKELFRFEVVRTDAMSADDFLVIGRATSGRIQAGDAVVVDVGDQPISTRVTAIDHTVENQEEFHMLIALQLEGIGPDTGIQPGTILRQSA